MVKISQSRQHQIGARSQMIRVTFCARNSGVHSSMKSASHPFLRSDALVASFTPNLVHTFERGMAFGATVGKIGVAGETTERRARIVDSGNLARTEGPSPCDDEAARQDHHKEDS